MLLPVEFDMFQRHAFDFCKREAMSLRQRSRQQCPPIEARNIFLRVTPDLALDRSNILLDRNPIPPISFLTGASKTKDRMCRGHVDQEVPYKTVRNFIEIPFEEEAPPYRCTEIVQRAPIF